MTASALTPCHAIRWYPRSPFSPFSSRSTTRSSALAMIAEVPGGMLSPMALRSSSLRPCHEAAQIPPAPPPTTAEAMMLGGKMSPTRPPAIAPRLAHVLPLGSAANVLNQLQSNGTVIGDVSHADAFELNIGANDIPYNRTRAARRSIATRASRSDGRT